MKRTWVVLVAIFIALTTGLVPSTARSTQAQAPTASGPILLPPVKPSSFNGDVRRLPAMRTPATPREIPAPRRLPRKITSPLSLPSFLNPRTTNASRSLSGALTNFEGLDGATWGFGWPPDPNGDVGPNHYIQAVNVSVGIFNKGGTRLAAFTLDDFFAGAATPCGNGNNQGDPIALYDPVSDRWIVADFAWTNFYAGPYYECIAVSKTSDPVSGGWWQYAFPADSNSLNDYPKLAVWADGIYMSANMFNTSFGGTDAGIGVWALNRNELINGLPLNAVRFTTPTGYNTLLPANLRGTLPPSGTPEFFASLIEPNQFLLWKFHMDWATPANSTFTGPSSIPVSNFVMPCNAALTFACVPQLNGESLDGLGDRLMMQLQYRNINGTESLWANHTIAANASVGTPTGIRWYEIRNPDTAPTVYQQGTYQPDSLYRWMGSLAVDKFGNMALGYSVSSAAMHPAIRFTGRLANDPLGTLPENEVTLIQGNNSQGSRFNRWGDYSAMSIDPSDDCTFWYTNEYYDASNFNWQTRIGSFKMPGCPHSLILPVISKNP